MQVAEIAEAAFECWWQEQHPGWMIFTLGNNHFESLDQIIKVQSSSTGTRSSSTNAVKQPPLLFVNASTRSADECVVAKGLCRCVSCQCLVQYSHGEGANIEGAIPIPKDNSAERTMSVRHISLYCQPLMLL